eukprot:916811-Pleurochrysis_carterae.AAC.1
MAADEAAAARVSGAVRVPFTAPAVPSLAGGRVRSLSPPRSLPLSSPLLASFPSASSRSSRRSKSPQMASSEESSNSGKRSVRATSRATPCRWRESTSSASAGRSSNAKAISAAVSSGLIGAKANPAPEIVRKAAASSGPLGSTAAIRAPFRRLASAG